MRAHPELYNVVELYRSGETHPYARRTGVFNVPRVGDEIDALGVTGEVVNVNWNLDYPGRAAEQWRCNIYIKELQE